MKDGISTVLYTKKTREYARHVRYWRDARGAQVSLISLFSCSSRTNHVTLACATSGERQGQRPFAHVKRVALQVITVAIRMWGLVPHIRDRSTDTRTWEERDKHSFPLCRWEPSEVAYIHMLVDALARDCNMVLRSSHMDVVCWYNKLENQYGAYRV